MRVALASPATRRNCAVQTQGTVGSLLPPVPWPTHVWQHLGLELVHHIARLLLGDVRGLQKWVHQGCMNRMGREAVRSSSSCRCASSAPEGRAQACPWHLSRGIQHRRQGRDQACGLYPEVLPASTGSYLPGSPRSWPSHRPCTCRYPGRLRWRGLQQRVQQQLG